MLQRLPAMGKCQYQKFALKSSGSYTCRVEGEIRATTDSLSFELPQTPFNSNHTTVSPRAVSVTSAFLPDIVCSRDTRCAPDFPTFKISGLNCLFLVVGNLNSQQKVEKKLLRRFCGQIQAAIGICAGDVTRSAGGHCL